VAFASEANNLVTNDTNGVHDIFAVGANSMPGVPTNLTALAVSSHRVNLLWDDNTTVEDAFEIWASMDGGAYSLIGTRVRNSRSFPHTGSLGNHTWEYRVRAVTNTGRITDFSDPATAIVVGQPLGMNAQALNSGQVQIRWKDLATNELGYEVWRGVNGGALTLLQSLGANSTTYIDSTVATNQTYRYQVRCVNGVHVSSPTNLDTVPVMLAPTNLVGNAISSNQIDLTWTDNSGGLEGGFQIYRRQGFSDFKLLATVGADVTTYSDTTVAARQPYDYQVRAVNVVDWSSFSNVRTVTTP
jgi:hypothetical protein